MKDNIHPKYTETTITCACGNVIETRSTRENIRVEICSQCHPFFTGKQKFVDSAGRVEKFKRKYAKVAKKDKKETLEKTDEQPKNAEDVLDEKAAELKQDDVALTQESSPDTPTEGTKTDDQGATE